MKRILWFVIGFAVALAVISSTQVQAQTPCATAAPTEAATASDLGTLDNPVLIGQLLVFATPKQNVFEIKVEKVTRGDSALKVIMAVNSFNATPPTGKEYAIVDVQFNFDKGQKPESIRYDDFAALTDGELVPAVHPVFTNQFDGNNMFPKAKTKHTIVLIVSQDDQTPLLAFNVGGDGTGGQYFSLQ